MNRTRGLVIALAFILGLLAAGYGGTKVYFEQAAEREFNQFVDGIKDRVAVTYGELGVTWVGLDPYLTDVTISSPAPAGARARVPGHDRGHRHEPADPVSHGHGPAGRGNQRLEPGPALRADSGRLRVPDPESRPAAPVPVFTRNPCFHPGECPNRGGRCRQPLGFRPHPGSRPEPAARHGRRSVIPAAPAQDASREHGYGLSRPRADRTVDADGPPPGKGCRWTAIAGRCSSASGRTRNGPRPGKAACCSRISWPFSPLPSA